MYNCHQMYHHAINDNTLQSIALSPDTTDNIIRIFCISSAKNTWMKTVFGRLKGTKWFSFGPLPVSPPNAWDADDTWQAAMCYLARFPNYTRGSGNLTRRYLARLFLPGKVLLEGRGRAPYNHVGQAGSILTETEIQWDRYGAACEVIVTSLVFLSPLATGG